MTAAGTLCSIPALTARRWSAAAGGGGMRSRAMRRSSAGAGFAQQHLARQLDPVLVVDGDDLDLQPIADLAHAIDLVNELVVQLADVAQAVAAEENFDERPEILDGGDAAFIDLADLDFLGDGFDLGLGLLGAGGAGVGDVHGAVIVNIDLGAGAFLDALDVLAARADQHADLLGIDLDDQEPRRQRAGLGARVAQRGDDVLEDLAAGIAGLVQRGPDDVLGDAVDFQVELDAGNAAHGAGHLEIHVAEVVLVPHDVGHEDEAVGLLDQADGDAGHRVADGHAGVHERQGAAAHAGHAAGTVRFEDVGHHADGVGELVSSRNAALDAAFAEGAVADLAPSRPAHGPPFPPPQSRQIVIW